MNKKKSEPDQKKSETDQKFPETGQFFFGRPKKMRKRPDNWSTKRLTKTTWTGLLSKQMFASKKTMYFKRKISTSIFQPTLTISDSNYDKDEYPGTAKCKIIFTYQRTQPQLPHLTALDAPHFYYKFDLENKRNFGYEV